MVLYKGKPHVHICTYVHALTHVHVYAKNIHACAIPPHKDIYAYTYTHTHTHAHSYPLSVSLARTLGYTHENIGTHIH